MKSLGRISKCVVTDCPIKNILKEHGSEDSLVSCSCPGYRTSDKFEFPDEPKSVLVMSGETLPITPPHEPQKGD